MFSLYYKLLLPSRDQTPTSSQWPIPLQYYHKLLDKQRDYALLLNTFDTLSWASVMAIHNLQVHDKKEERNIADVLTFLQFVVDLIPQSYSTTTLDSSHSNTLDREAKSAVLSMHLCRVQALLFFKLGNFIQVVGVLNSAVTTINNNFASGTKDIGNLIDILCLISEAYINLGHYADSLHSAKLAVSLSHEHQKNTLGSRLGRPLRLQLTAVSD